MNAPIWVAWAVFTLCAVISVVLLAGKGSFLIAGYNMMNGEEQRQYNERRLCRVMGGGLGGLTVILGIATLYRFEMPTGIDWIIPWGLFGTVAVMLVLAHTFCKQMPSENDNG